MTCVSQRDLCVIRGDSFEENVGFSDGWTDLIADPSSYVVNMVFRETQDDDLTPYLELSAVPVAAPEHDRYAVIAYLTATAAQTQSLPDWRHVHYVEIQKTGGDPTRLYQGKVRIGD